MQVADRTTQFLIDMLKETGLCNNTILIMSTDNDDIPNVIPGDVTTSEGWGTKGVGFINDRHLNQFGVKLPKMCDKFIHCVD